MLNTVPKKNLVIALHYLGKLSLQIRTRIKRIMKNKLPYCNIRFVFQTSARLVTFLHLKTKFHRSYVLALFINFIVVAIMAKLSVILKSECADTWEFLHSLGKELKLMMIPPLKSIFYSAITHLILKISQFLQPTTESLLINRYHTPLNKNKQSLPLELFDS